MRKSQWLVLMLTLFVPGFALPGAFASMDNGKRSLYVGVTAGAIGSAVFGLLFGDGLPRKWTHPPGTTQEE